jgi:hypothetical protein
MSLLSCGLHDDAHQIFFEMDCRIEPGNGVSRYFSNAVRSVSDVVSTLVIADPEK